MVPYWFMNVMNLFLKLNELESARNTMAIASPPYQFHSLDSIFMSGSWMSLQLTRDATMIAKRMAGMVILVLRMIRY